MKIKIIEIKEVSGQLRIKVNTDYGVEDIGLSLDKKRLDPITMKPLWYYEVLNLLKKKYKNAVSPIFGEELVGKDLEI